MVCFPGQSPVGSSGTHPPAGCPGPQQVLGSLCLLGGVTRFSLVRLSIGLLRTWRHGDLLLSYWGAERDGVNGRAADLWHHSGPFPRLAPPSPTPHACAMCAGIRQTWVSVPHPVLIHCWDVVKSLSVSQP